MPIIDFIIECIEIIGNCVLGFKYLSFVENILQVRFYLPFSLFFLLFFQSVGYGWKYSIKSRYLFLSFFHIAEIYMLEDVHCVTQILFLICS